MVFSHGYVGHCGLYTGYIREVVSHGYIVFAIDHLDGSCKYTQLKDATPKPLDTDAIFWDAE